MGRHYVHTLSIPYSTGDVPEADEVEVTVCYAVTWGAPEQGPSYASGGQPADPDEIDDITVTHINGAIVVGAGLSEEARALEAVIEASDGLMATLLEVAAEAAAHDHADAMERRAEERREAL